MGRPVRFLALIVAGLILAGCSVLNPTERLPPPTPLPTPEPFQFNLSEAAVEPFTPGVGFQPDLDPDILALMSAVSEQQLIAYVQALQGFFTRNSFSDSVNETSGVGAARRWIYSEFERVGNGRLQVQFEDFDMTYAGISTRQRNVVATLPGISSYSGVAVIGAHYDTRLELDTDGTSFSPSANDNASGVAMLLELARLMSSRQWNQTIVFVAFAAEEQQTAGSRAFVNQSFINQRQIRFAMSNDTVGGRPGIPQSIRVFAPEMETSKHGQVARYMDFLAQLYLPDFPLELNNAPDREGRYGDQREFQEVGIGAVRLTESIEDPTLLNSPSDTWEKIDYTYLSQVVRLNLTTLANWAGAPPPPAPPAVITLDEPGSFALSWSADAQAASYAVSFRPIDSLRLPLLRTVSTEDAGNVILTGFDPQETYAVSVAPISFSGKLGGFSEEVIVFPTQTSASNQ